MTDFIPRPEGDLIPLDFDDRRRLGVSSALIALEQGEGMITPIAFGGIVLSMVADESEVVKMADQVTMRLNTMFGPPPRG